MLLVTWFLGDKWVDHCKMVILMTWHRPATLLPRTTNMYNKQPINVLFFAHPLTFQDSNVFGAREKDKFRWYYVVSTKSIKAKLGWTLEASPRPMFLGSPGSVTHHHVMVAAGVDDASGTWTGQLITAATRWKLFVGWFHPLKIDETRDRFTTYNSTVENELNMYSKGNFAMIYWLDSDRTFP